MAAAVVLGACVTVILVGLGWVLSWATEMPSGFALLIVAVVAVAVSLAAVALCRRAMMKALDPLRRSGAEFRTNIQWIRQALGSSEGLRRPPPRPGGN